MRVAAREVVGGGNDGSDLWSDNHYQSRVAPLRCFYRQTRESCPVFDEET